MGDSVMAGPTNIEHKTYIAPTGQVIVRKKRTKFLRPESDRYKRVKTSWRKPRGIDSPTRRGFRGARLMPNRGYGNDKRTRGMKLNGKYDIVVRNAKELEALVTKKDRYDILFQKSMGSKKRAELIERANQLGLRVANFRAKVTIEEKN